MRCIINGQILHKGQFLKNKAIIFDSKIINIMDQEKIKYMDIESVIDAKGQYVIPGFIDIHIHGYKGHDTMEGDKEILRTISHNIAENGVTSFLPTTMTMDVPAIHKALDTIKEVMDEKSYGAEILGAHLEGPFISSQYKGAQNEAYIIPPSGDVIKGYEDIIKIITIAPEVEGALDFIEKYTKDNNIKFSIGHSSATYEQAIEGINKGACSTTHFFNAMTGLSHRNPGVVGAVMNTDVVCELIADTIHVNPVLFDLLVKIKGLDKILLITDAMMGAGLGDGEYDLGGQKVYVNKGKCVLSNGTIAGSVITLNKAVYNFTRHSLYELARVIDLATINQAKLIDVEDRKGTLDIGKDADIIITNNELDIYLTIGKGKILYEKAN